MEENFMLVEMYHNTRKDPQGIISQLEGQLDDQKAEERSLNDHIESLKSDMMIKSEMQTRI
jgi:cell division protein FtsB